MNRGNIYDHRALEIYTLNGKKLGYVPRIENPIPSRITRQNIKLTGVIEKINYNEEDWQKVKVQLFYESVNVKMKLGIVEFWNSGNE